MLNTNTIQPQSLNITLKTNLLVLIFFVFLIWSIINFSLFVVKIFKIHQQFYQYPIQATHRLNLLSTMCAEDIKKHKTLSIISW